MTTKPKGVIFDLVWNYIVDGGHREPKEGTVWWIIAVCRGKLDPKGLVDYVYGFDKPGAMIAHVSSCTDDFVDRLGKWGDFERRHKLDKNEIQTAGNILNQITRRGK